MFDKLVIKVYTGYIRLNIKKPYLKKSKNMTSAFYTELEGRLLTYMEDIYKGDKNNFVNMLQKKCYFAKQKNIDIFCVYKMCTRSEIEKMLTIADDF